MTTTRMLVSAGSLTAALVLLLSPPARPHRLAHGGGNPPNVAICGAVATAPLFAQPRRSYTDTRELCVEIRDAGNNDPLAARVGVFDPAGNPVPPEDRETHIYNFYYTQSYFYVDSAACMAVPTGEITIYSGRGFEYFPVDTTLEVVSDTTVVLYLERFTDIVSEGWFSGDTHVHLTHSPVVYELDAADLLLVSRSEDLNYINSMEGPAFFRGELEPLSQPDRLLYFSREQGNPHFAHLTLLGIKEYPPGTACEAPLGTSFCGRTLDKAVHELIHAQGEEVAVVATHPFPTFNLWDMSPWPGSGVWRGMPLDLVSGAVDAVDILCYTHASPPEGVEFYFHALNAGFRVPSSAGTDAGIGRGNSRPPGGYRVYVKPVDGVLTLDGWIAGFKNGRSFVTNYPLISSFELEEYTVGDVIEYDGGMLRGRVSAFCVEPMDSLTIIGNGRVLHAFKPSAESRGLEISAEFTIDPREITWVLARVEGGVHGPAGRWHNMNANGLFAQTAPIYVENQGTDDKRRDPMLLTTAPVFRRDAANYFLDFLDGLERIFDANGDFPGDSRETFDRVMRVARNYYRLAAGDPPEAFDMIGPCETWNKPYAVVQTSRPTFVWQRAVDPDPGEYAKYILAIDTLPGFETANLISTLHDTTYTPSKKDSLVEGVTYYWRVRAFDPTGYEVASTTDCCTLMVSFDPTGIRRDTPAVEWAIDRVYPNPFGQRVRIHYTAPEGGRFHEVSIYDVNGRLVRRLYRGNRGGPRRLEWNGRLPDGAPVASGIYFVRLMPENATALVTKVVLLR